MSIKRPFLKFAINKIESLFKKGKDNPVLMRQIKNELEHRKTKRSKKLKKEVNVKKTTSDSNNSDEEGASSEVKKIEKNYTTNGKSKTNIESENSIQVQNNPKETLQELLSRITLKEFVNYNLVPARVKNSILAEDDEFIIFDSVYSFITASDRDRGRLKKLEFFGKKSLNDLVISIENYIKQLNKGSLNDLVQENKLSAPPIDEAIQNSLNATQTNDLKNIPMDFFVGSCSMVNVRTKNAILKANGLHEYETLFDFWVAPDKHKKNLLNLNDFGKNSLNNLIESISFLITEDGELARLSNFVTKKNDIKVCESIDDIVDYAVSSILTNKEQLIVKKRYLDVDILTLNELGVRLSISRERVRQIESKAMKKIQGFILSLSMNDSYLKFKLELKNSLFKGCDFVSIGEARKAVKDASKSIVLYIKIFDNSLENFLNNWFFYSDKYEGWFVSKDVKSECEEKFNFKDGLRIEQYLQKASWPIALADLSNMMNTPECVLRDAIAQNNKNYIEDLQNGAFVRFKKITVKNAVRYVLRRYQRGLSLDEVKSGCRDMFDLEVSIGNIGNALGELPDGLIVDTGTYALYEYLDITDKQLAFIRDFCVQFILNEGKYISAFVIFNSLKKEANFFSKFGNLDNGHVTFGICQDDDRFITKKGFMLGLNLSEFDGEYLSLTQEVINLMKKESRPLTVSEIIEKLSDTRCLFWSSLFGMLDHNPHGIFEKIGNTFYLANDKNHLEVSDDDLLEYDF